MVTPVKKIRLLIIALAAVMTLSSCTWFSKNSKDVGKAEPDRKETVSPASAETVQSVPGETDAGRELPKIDVDLLGQPQAIPEQDDTASAPKEDRDPEIPVQSVQEDMDSSAPAVQQAETTEENVQPEALGPHETEKVPLM